MIEFTHFLWHVVTLSWPVVIDGVVKSVPLWSCLHLIEEYRIRAASLYHVLSFCKGMFERYRCFCPLLSVQRAVCLKVLFIPSTSNSWLRNWALKWSSSLLISRIWLYWHSLSERRASRTWSCDLFAKPCALSLFLPCEFIFHHLIGLVRATEVNPKFFDTCNA